MVIQRLYNETSIELLYINETDYMDVQFSESVKVMIIVLISVLVTFTVFGNTLVILAFMVDKRLRTRSNFFLLNLAICDFVIGAFVSPLYVHYLLTGSWIFGEVLCKLWLISDYTICTASALNIVLISYDRFLSVTRAVVYRSLQKNHSQTALKMATVWIMSFLLYGPAVIFWESVFGIKDMSDSVCRAAFYDTWYFHLGTSCFDFFLPLLSISFFNLSIYWNISKRTRGKSQPIHHLPDGKEEHVTPFFIATNLKFCSEKPDGKNDNLKIVQRKIIRKCLQTKCKSSSSAHAIPNTLNVQVIKLSRDKKVARSLAVLVSVFALCWAPYTFLISIRTACRGYCIPSYWYDITVWMLYLNSSINPILYPLCHSSFRRSFVYIFHICFKGI